MDDLERKVIKLEALKVFKLKDNEFLIPRRISYLKYGGIRIEWDSINKLNSKRKVNLTAKLARRSFDYEYQGWFNHLTPIKSRCVRATRKYPNGVAHVEYIVNSTK